jgi:hypothetical protein
MSINWLAFLERLDFLKLLYPYEYRVNIPSIQGKGRIKEESIFSNIFSFTPQIQLTTPNSAKYALPCETTPFQLDKISSPVY